MSDVTKSLVGEDLHQLNSDVVEAKHIAEDYYSVGYGSDLMQVLFHKPTGYVNVSILVKDYGKEFKCWKRTKANETLVAAVSALINKSALIKTKKENYKALDALKLISGTYAHP